MSLYPFRHFPYYYQFILNPFEIYLLLEKLTNPRLFSNPLKKFSNKIFAPIKFVQKFFVSLKTTLKNFCHLKVTQKFFCSPKICPKFFLPPLKIFFLFSFNEFFRVNTQLACLSGTNGCYVRHISSGAPKRSHFKSSRRENANSANHHNEVSNSPGGTANGSAKKRVSLIEINKISRFLSINGFFY